MTTQDLELERLSREVEALAAQNRRMKRAGLAVLAFAGLAVLMGGRDIRPSERISEIVRDFSLRDQEGIEWIAGKDFSVYDLAKELKVETQGKIAMGEGGIVLVLRPVGDKIQHFRADLDVTKNGPGF